MYRVIHLINNLELPNEITNHIRLFYKYDLLEKKYKKRYNELISHLQYYIWINKKLNKKDNANQTLIKTIKEYDYYSP
mgnify:FL=1|jgi:hypothetical protein